MIFEGCFLKFFIKQTFWALIRSALGKTCKPGAGCSKLTTSLVNVSLKFQMLILQIHCYFLLKKCDNLLHCKRFSHFFNKKTTVDLIM